MALESLPKIAPALFSAEQDLIQIYNKKSDTTGVINPSYIKSSPSGVAGAIQFSDGSAFASSSNLTWNNATNALGLGSGTTSAFIDFASNPAGSNTIVGAIRTYVDGTNLSEVMSFREDGRIGVLNTNPAYTFDVNGTINARFAFNQDSANANQINGIINQGGANQAVTGINCLRLNAQVSMMVGAAQAPTATLHVKGSGSTSATTALLVKNSTGLSLMTIPDGAGRITFGLDLEAGTFFGQVYIPGKLFLGSSGSAVFGNDSLDASAVLQANSTTKGFLPPRMTDAQIRAIVSPANGLVAYNTDINHLCCYQNGAWAKFSHSPM